MKKRIFLYMFLTNFMVITIMATLLSFIFYDFFSADKSSELKQSTAALAQIMEKEENKLLFLQGRDFTGEQNRVTLIDQSGKVLFDSYAQPESMDNHAGRPEIISAAQYGAGAYKRFSATASEETYYYAVKLTDGSIVRMSRTTDSIRAIFLTTLPWLFLIVIITASFSLAVSSKLTKKIIDPINELNLAEAQTVVYEELTPLVSRIDKQKQQINLQINELERRTKTIRTIIQDMREGIILIDKEKQILSINQSALSIFAEAGQSFTDKNILELTRDPVISENIRLALQGQTLNMLLTLDKKTFEVFFDPVRDNQQIMGLVILFMDVTSKNTAEKMRREFSANVSHELKTPLTTILGYSEIIENGMAKQEDVNFFAQKIKNQVIHLIKLIENIIKISLNDERAIDKDFEDFELTGFVNDIIDSFLPEAKRNNISLTHLEGHVFVKANKTMFRELLTNLLDNAIKYNKPDGKVDVTLVKQGGRLLLTIKDTGIGIAQDKLTRVFERFYRVEPSRSKKTGGTGLGLSIVKHIVQYHDGEINIDSKLDEGTTISIFLNILI